MLSIAIAGFLVSPLRFMCEVPTFLLLWVATALTCWLILWKGVLEKVPVLGRLAALLVAVFGFTVILLSQPSEPYHQPLDLAEAVARWVKDMRDPMPVPRYVPHPAKPRPVQKPFVPPPLRFSPMIADPAPDAALTYYRNVETAFYTRKNRFGTLYELGNHGAVFVPPTGYMLAEIEQDEIGQPLDRAERTGLCVYPVVASAEKLTRYILADRKAREWEAGWRVVEVNSLDHKRNVKRWPARQSAVAAPPPDMTPKILATRARLSRISITLRRFVEEQHRVPSPSEALEKFPMLSHGELVTADLLDGWGRPFSYEQGAVLRAISLGPDGKPATPDDITTEIEGTYGEIRNK